MMVKFIKAAIFDLDGTIYLGEKVIPGAPETLKWVRKHNIDVRFVTNNPRFSKRFYADKLNHLGVHAKKEEVVTSANLTADYLSENEKYGNVFVIGEKQLIQELLMKDIPIVDHNRADTVLVSFDTTLNYHKLQTAYQALLNGASFIATNPDSVCPTPEGGLVDAGAIIAALEKATGRKLEKVIGKPSVLMAELLLEEFNVSPENCMIVGDRLNTDIRMGKHASMKTVWINANHEDIPKNFPYKPDYQIDSIKSLTKIFEQTQH